MKEFSLQFWQLVVTKVFLNLKSEASRFYLSYLWWILEPVLLIGTYYVVFALIMTVSTPNYLVFLTCGKIPFIWFARSVPNASGSIAAGRGLMNQIKIPKLFFPIVTILQDSIKSAVVLFLLLLFVTLQGFPPDAVWLSLPLIILLQLLFILCAGITVSLLVPFFPDVRFLVSTWIMIMLFASGIFYDYKNVLSPEHYELFLLNPMARLISMYRDVLITSAWPDFTSMWSMGLACLTYLTALFFVAKKLDSTFPRLVLE